MKRRVLPALIVLLFLIGCGHEHTPGQWEVVTPAACVTEGAWQKVCADCGEVVESGIIPAAGHADGWRVTREATCTQAGSEVNVCQTCGVWLGEESLVKTGHVKGEWTVIKQATCAETGAEVCECAGCGEVMEERVVAALGHDDQKAVTPPTKTERGYSAAVCTRCGRTNVGDFVDALGSTGLAWEQNGDGKTCTVTGIGTCTDSWVVIPAEIEGYTVDAIGRGAFCGVAGIKEMTIPASVELIGHQAFDKCADLRTVYYYSVYANRENPFLASSPVTKVVFGGKEVPDRILENAAQITEVVIAGEVTSIGSYAFFDCSGLRSVAISSEVTSVGSSAFAGCRNLRDVVLPESVTSIGYRAFYECRSLRSMVIPDGVTEVGEYALFDCAALKTISIPANLDISQTGIEFVRTGVKEELQIIRR